MYIHIETNFLNHVQEINSQEDEAILMLILKKIKRHCNQENNK